MKARLIALALVAGTPAAAQSPAAPGAAAIPGWDALVEGLRVLPEKMLAKLPPAERDDPQIRAEAGRLALEALTAATFDAIGGDGDYPVFLPQLGQLLNIGQPNADTVYRMARITPGGTYRIRGRKGSLRMAVIAEVGRPAPTSDGKPPAAAPHRADHDLDAVPADANGMFDLILSPTRPAGYGGTWWPLRPETNRLLLRMVKADWAREQDMTIAIERLDAPAARPRTSAATLEARLRALPAATTFSATMFLDHVEQLRQAGFVNRLKNVDFSQMGGLSGQSYYEGSYDLKDDEALLLETRVPAGCTYSSLILTNPLYETTDWYNHQASLNDTQAKPDADGVLRVVVAKADPGIANWLDTAGYPVGVIQGRWVGCSGTPVPSVRKLPLKAVAAALPPATRRVTPAERETMVRERRFLLQQRPLW